MSKTIEQLIALAQQVKNETESKQNTATRVGGLSEDIIDKIEDVITSLATVAANEGTLSSLTTTQKGNLVAAINELVTAISARYTKTESDAITGALNSLATSVKTSLVGAINDLESNKATKSEVATIGSKVGNISTETTTEDTQELVFSKDNGTLIGKINDNGLDFVSVKKNGVEVLTQHQDISGKADKTYVDTEVAKKQNTLTAGTGVTIENNVISASGVGDLPISGETITEDSEEQIWSNDSATETYAKIGSYGVKAKAFFDLDGNEIGSADKKVNTFLPAKIYGVVGNKQQLFVRGINMDFNPYNNYNYFKCSEGKTYERYFEITPSKAGNLTLTQKVYDSKLNELASLTTTLQVCAVPSSPTSQTNVLCVGSSSTAEGQWANELKRMLTSTTSVDYVGNSAPTGLGLTNISFVGRLNKRNVKVEATGGWTWGTFTSAGISAIRFQVTGVNNVAVGSRYKYTDADGKIGQVVVAEVNVTGSEGNIRFTYASSTATKAVAVENGTLTKYEGGGDATISYTTSAKEEYSPFWDATNERVSFTQYANDYCNGSIDVCIVSLSAFNDTKVGYDDLTPVLANQKKFLDALHRDFPNCKVLLISGIGCSCQYGLEYNYSASSKFNTNDVRMMFYRYAKELDAVCKSVDYSSFVYYVNSYAEVDQENIFPTADKAKNARTTDTEKVGTNGVHPTETGYNMIADSVYRCFCNVIL